MPAAPYTPQTLANIRQATKQNTPRDILARGLGWELRFLESVARKHGIELKGSGPRILVADKPTLSVKQASTPAPPRPPAGKLGGRFPALSPGQRDGISWDPETRIVTHGARKLKLTCTELHIFGFLVRADAPIEVHWFAQRAGYASNTTTFKVQISKLRKRLVKIGLTITSARGAAGTYQLLKVKQ